jgi:SAM-dependent methyltransferase
MTEERRQITRVDPWASLLDYVELPGEGKVLCVGTDPAGLVNGLRRRDLDGVGLLTPGQAVSGPAASYVAGRMQALPVCDSAVVGVVCTDALHVQDDPEAVLAEMRRVLRPGGLLVIHEPLAGVDDDIHLTPEELCAHLAGEQLAVTAHRQQSSTATWVLQVPVRRPERTRTYIQEDR